LKPAPRSLLVAAACFALGAGAIAVGAPVRARPVGEVLEPAGPVVPAWVTRVDSVRAGDTPTGILQRMGVSSDVVLGLQRAFSAFNPKGLRASSEVVLRTDPEVGPVEVVFRLSEERSVRFRRTDAGEWEEIDERLAWTMDTVSVTGVVRTSLTEAILNGDDAFPKNQRGEVASRLSGVLEYRIDLSRELHRGDSVEVLIERLRAPTGAAKPGQVLATRLYTGGKRIEAIRHTGRQGTVYLDGDGRSVETGFIKNPIAYNYRVSSTFGNRRHPILGDLRRHTGIDFAAARGTPVRAVGAGTVIFAGWKGGYGNTIEIRHGNGYVTRYGHLSKLLAKVGTRVAPKETIGLVGATGLATGPHLHFELLVKGVHRNPNQLPAQVETPPLQGAERQAFMVAKQQLLGRLDAMVFAAARDRVAPTRLTGD
jgi:murein DD-endopeptidase MepM/ murein hydrolase activator NlpD